VKLAEYWKHLYCTVPEGIYEQGAIHSTIVTLKKASCQKIPEPSESTRALPDALEWRYGCRKYFQEKNASKILSLHF
jgi:hypothetical protein